MKRLPQFKLDVGVLAWQVYPAHCDMEERSRILGDKARAPACTNAVESALHIDLPQGPSSIRE